MVIMLPCQGRNGGSIPLARSKVKVPNMAGYVQKILFIVIALFVIFIGAYILVEYYLLQEYKQTCTYHKPDGGYKTKKYYSFDGCNNFGCTTRGVEQTLRGCGSLSSVPNLLRARK